MEEGGRSRSSLSSLASSQRTLSANFSPTSRLVISSAGFGNYTETWISKNSSSISPEMDTCRQIKNIEEIIDELQVKAEKCRKSKKANIEKGALQAYLEKIEEAEKQLMQIGPCPIPDCTRHHETAMDDVMLKAGQYYQYQNYPLPKTPTSPSKPTYSNAFQMVSPEKAARPQLGKSQSPIDTANRFHNIMDTTENEIPNDTEIKISIPDINLKLSVDYNLTIQEITRKFPETICKYNRGYIRISPHSHVDRENIIELLNTSEKEYVLSEAPENRPVKIVIKDLPPDHDKDIIAQELESKNFKVIRINQLRNIRLKTLLPIFLVELAKTPNVNDIVKIDKISNFKIKIEQYRKKQRATMCFNCSDFFHSARNCKCKPRCIKCNGTHETRMCSIKTKIDNPVCINCKENGHLASWKGCPKYPVIRNNSPPTYAQKLKSNLQKPKNSPTPPISKPIPQIDTDTYDKFEKNMNALKIINDAFNKFPNLIEISEKIKIAKTDFEIVSLLKIFKI
ncbi:hypothetical protein AVEN_32776-1 [Araneus ventricosus]|uniref:Pre-C2HC domain-containing protein n=1 Tax=Araneus ventricosus TaxID=182803 RepID=A0A4Y2U4M6_ARAVE|nr:hypothetical protein AVEN_32776-1 [Araneus ventricosus]